MGIYFRQDNNYQYALTDHTGSVRAIINRNKLSNGNADVVYYADYYPFGTVLRSGGAGGWRYGCQGEYAEKDGETGWNNFELRNYDAAIGRWLTTDPYGQYWSPYVGMGNNPILLVDADGGWASGDDPKAKVWDPSTPYYNLLPEIYIGRPFEFKRNPAYSPWMGPSFFNEPPTMDAALVFAGTAAVSDGPFPIGEAVGTAVVVGTAIYLTPSIVEKMNREIARIEERIPGGNGFQYALVATTSGMYPNVRGGTTYLNEGDVWKYDETTQGEDRYTQNYLNSSKVRIVPQFFGNIIEIKIQEKIMIYGHFAAHGALPPGNKIFR